MNNTHPFLKTILLLYLSFFLFCYGQAQRVENIAIHFSSNSSEISPEEKNKLLTLIKEGEINSIYLKGHTDYIGTSAYNLNLSQRRVESVRVLLMDSGVDPILVRAEHFGEEKPLESNIKEAGRALNRRVEVNIVYKVEELLVQVEQDHEEESSETVEEEEERDFIPDNKDLHQYLHSLNEVQKFRISIHQNTTIVSKGGAIFSFEKGSFETHCQDSILISIREYNDKKSMILGNVQTVSNGDLLYSYGMFEVWAYCGEEKVQLKEGRKFTLMVPDSQEGEPSDELSGYYGIRDPESGEVNWIGDNSYIGRACVFMPLECKEMEQSKRCFLRRWFTRKGQRKKWQDCQSLQEEIFSFRENYKGIDVDSLPLTSRRTYYYVLQPQRLGLCNLDDFWNFPALISSLVTIKVFLLNKLRNNTEVKLVFVNRRSMVSPHKTTNKKATFRNISKREPFYIVGIRKTEDGEIQAAVEKFESGKNKIELKLEPIDSIDELEILLRTLN